MKRWIQGGMVLVGTGLSSCCINPFGTSTCNQTRPVAWNGLTADGGTWVGGAVEPEVCALNCGSGDTCTAGRDAGTLSCTTLCVGGRAPAGLASLSAVDGSAGAWIARMAELETAAVVAFARLADELDAHGLAAHAHHARQAALDEVRHADAVTRLALRLGHCPAPVHVGAAGPVRTLEEIAIENAAEGCGRELYGAVLNGWQAEHAADDRVRAVMGSIAGEERAHAGYSFQLAGALASRLTVPQRRRAAEAQARMLSAFADHDVAPAARRALGLMDGDDVVRTARQLLDTARL